MRDQRKHPQEVGSKMAFDARSSKSVRHCESVCGVWTGMSLIRYGESIGLSSFVWTRMPSSCYLVI